MADHLSQYSMVPNFGPGNAGMMQHHQLNAMQQQQPAQQQQDPQQAMSAFNDQNAWSRMQHQMRAQNGQDAQQMANLIRSQNLASMQSQQQQQQQRFGLGIGGPSPGQQPSFLEQQQNQTPHNMQMGFNGMEQHNPNFQQRQNLLHSRQLELMGLAHNQQNQNSPTNLGNRVNSGLPVNGGSQGLNTFQPPNDLFNSPNDMRRPSPHPPLQPPLMNNQPPNGNGMPQNSRANITVQGRTINIGDLTERAGALRNMIQTQEMAVRQLQQQRPSLPDSVFMTKMRAMQNEINSRRESLTKIMTLMNICMQQGNNGGPINVGGPSQGAPPPGNGGQPWQPSPFGNTQPLNMPTSQPHPPTPGTRASPVPHPPNGLPINSANNVPPRSGPTPQNPFPMNASPLNFPVNNSPANGPPGPSSLGPNPNAASMNLNSPIAPLDKSRFETSYKQWCLTKAIVHDPRLLSIDSRQIDLYQLHCHVMREGGIANVTRKELWPVIGGRLNIVHFPGSATEPPKSGPAAAMHIQHVYKEYLSAFDTVYMASVMDSRRKAAGLPPTSQLSGQLPGQFAPGGPSMPFNLEALRHMNPTQLRTIIMCADKPVPELRARGLSENMINFVETHRSNLQRMGAEQESFGNELRRQPAGQGGPGLGPPGQPPFTNSGMPNLIRGPEHPGPHPIGSAFSRPTREQMSIAQLSINKLKADYTARVLPMMPTVEIPPESRMEYNQILEVVFRNANDLDNKLPIYSAATKSEENTRKLLSAIVSVQHQRSLLSSANPKYVISFETLRIFSNNLQNAGRQIHIIIQNIVKAGEQHPHGEQHQQPPLSQLPPQAYPQVTHRPPMSVPTKAKKSTSAPTPPASASTPVANPPTPSPAAAASPQTPKSPKTKLPAKKQPKSRKPSTPKVNATPTIEPAPVPDPSITAGVKRAREEEPEAAAPQPISGPSTGPSSNPLPQTPSSVANEPSPPKKVKTDWEGPVSESLQKKNQEVENIKTEEDATQFLEQMTELIKMAGTEDQASLSSDISETLDQLLKGYGGLPDSDPSAFSSLGLGEVNGSLDASTSNSGLPASGSGDLTEFFDFSLFPNEEEDESKTPDLISSSSTNPSPESQADVLDVKQEEYDPVRLGPLKGIDGGESAYFQSTNWRWDGQMAAMDPPWAIFNT
jgi:hypothetical protein